MAWSANLLDPKIEKHPLVILRPRTRVTGWTASTGNFWVADFTAGVVSRAWRTFANDEGQTVHSSAPAGGGSGSGDIWQDLANGKIYWDYGSAPGPDDAANAAIFGTIPGITLEVSLYLSDQERLGPSDPLDASSPVVEWLGVLRQAPSAASGDKTALYGFNPLTDSAIEIDDQDGFLMPFLHAYTFHNATVRSYVMADRDLESAALFLNVKEVFRGYAGQPKENAEGLFSIECFDFLALIDRAAEPAANFDLTNFPLADPQAVKFGQEWYIRRVRGLVDGHVPVGIQFNATPGTTVNRKFATHEGTAGDGTVVQTVKTSGVTNTTTKTYLSAAPKMNVGDAVVVQRSGVDKYVFVLTVDHATNFITHAPITGTALNTDSVTRYYIGWVKIKDENGTWWNLFAKRDFTMIDHTTESNSPNWLGFKLIDNFEADISFPSTFDPGKHEILCRVYGTAVIDKYSDGTTDVGQASIYGGVASNAVSLLFWLLREAGVSSSLIDATSFQAVATSHELGIAIPRAAADVSVPTYKDLIQLVLQSMIWRLVYVDTATGVKIGLLETGPFGSADYSVDDQDYRNVGFEHDYTALADSVLLGYGFKESSRLGDFDVFLVASSINSADGTQAVFAENLYAREVHQVSNQFSLTDGILQFLVAQAQVIANRYAFALGDRRAYYSLTFGPEFLAKTALGASYQISRDRLPGYAYVEDTQHTRQLLVIESTKSAHDATLTLEDQKGIQDNSGSW